MTTTPTAPAPEKKPKIKANPKELLEERFTERPGYKRKIVNVFGNYWRVNFHDTDGFDVDSYFCEMIDGEIKVHPEGPKRVKDPFERD
jgi:hypothetical protein